MILEHMSGSYIILLASNYIEWNLSVSEGICLLWFSVKLHALPGCSYSGCNSSREL